MQYSLSLGVFGQEVFVVVKGGGNNVEVWAEVEGVFVEERICSRL